MRLLDRGSDGQVTVRALRPDAVPAEVRSASPLQRLNYGDIAILRTLHATRWTPEQWTRAIVERGRAVRTVGPPVWRGIVGLRLDTQAAAHVAGWRVGGSGDDWFRLEAASWHLTVHAVLRVAVDHVSLSLLVRYDNPAAVYLWPPVGVLHRRGIPLLLREAEQLLAGDEETA